MRWAVVIPALRGDGPGPPPLRGLSRSLGWGYLVMETLQVSDVETPFRGDPPRVGRPAETLESFDMRTFPGNSLGNVWRRFWPALYNSRQRSTRSFSRESHEADVRPSRHRFRWGAHTAACRNVRRRGTALRIHSCRNCAAESPAPPWYCAGGTPGQQCSQSPGPRETGSSTPYTPSHPPQSPPAELPTLTDPNGVFSPIANPLPGIRDAYCSSFPDALGCK